MDFGAAAEQSSTRERQSKAAIEKEYDQVLTSHGYESLGKKESKGEVESFHVVGDGGVEIP